MKCCSTDLNQEKVTIREIWSSMRFRFNFLTVVTLLLLSLVLVATSSSATVTQLVLTPNGANVAHLGSRQSTSQKALSQLLGKPTEPLRATPGLVNCGVEAMSSWHSFSAYFNHGLLVGLSLGPGATPTGRTSRGLLLGDTLALARSLYGASLRTSTEQGGVWFVRTNKGRLDGFLVPSNGRTPKPSARILTIDVGVVGCPAMSP